MHPTTIQRYRDGKLQPTRDACLEFTALALAEEALDRDNTGIALDRRRQDMVFRHWLELTGHDAQIISNEDFVWITGQVQHHLFCFLTPEPEQRLMDVCHRTQELAESRADLLLKHQRTYCQPVVVSFFWRWRDRVTVEELKIQQSAEYIDNVLEGNPKAQVWMFFAIENTNATQQVKDQIQEIKTLGDTGEQLQKKYKNRIRVYTGGRDDHAYLGDYWLYLPDSAEHALAFFIGRNKRLEKHANRPDLEHVRKKMWSYCNQAVELHDEQIKELMHYLGVRHNSELTPPWQIMEGQWNWKLISP